MASKRPPAMGSLIPSDKVIAGRGYVHTLTKTKDIVRALNEINPRQIDEIARWVRREVYKMGLDGGYDGLQRQATEAAEWEQRKIDGLHNPLHDEDSPSYSVRLRKWRTYYALRALSFIDETILCRLTGDANAVFRPEEQPERVPKVFLNDRGELVRDIDEKTPLDQLIDIVAFTERPELIHSAEQEGVVMDRGLLRAMGRSAHARLIEHLISSDKNFIEVGRKFFSAYHYNEILHRSPGALSEGRIGRKAAGMILAYAVLAADIPEFDAEFASKKNFSGGVEGRDFQRLRKIVEDSVTENNSFFIGSDLLKSLIANNSELAYLRVLKYMDDEGGDDEKTDAEVRARVDKAVFPSHLLRQLKNFFDMLSAKIGGNPFIVRSSSALEDQLGASFAGMYDSVICSGQDFDEFVRAIKKVYASVFSSKVIKYRKSIDLIDFDESMGLLVQELNGEWRGRYFLPDFAGVALSHAPQSPGPDPEAGMMTVVMGLGEKVVQNGGKIVWFEKPGYHFGGKRDRYCQEDVCVVDKTDGKVKDIAMKVLLGQNGVLTTALVEDIFTDRNDMVVKTKFIDNPEQCHATFDGMVSARKPVLPFIIEYIVKKLEYALGHKVDIEFTAKKMSDGTYRVKVVQCRPQNVADNLKPAAVPEYVSSERILFRSGECLSSGHAENVRYLLYISPDVYSSGHPEQLNHEEMNVLRQWISVINSKMKEKEYAIVAPGRWGDNPESELGVYAVAGDYTKCAAIVEVVGDGHWKDIAPSAGTHDYQLIVEKGIAVFSLNQSAADNVFRSELLEGQESVLGRFLDGHPVPERLARWLKVIDAENMPLNDSREGITGARFHIAMDNTGERAGASLYIAEKDKDLPVIKSI